MVEFRHMAHKLVVLGPMQIFSAILESVTIFSGPVVILSAILGLVTSVLANLGGVGTILAGSNIVMYFH